LEKGAESITREREEAGPTLSNNVVLLDKRFERRLAVQGVKVGIMDSVTQARS